MGDAAFDRSASWRSDSALLGTVLAVQANFYWVKLERSMLLAATEHCVDFLLCTRRSRLKKIGQQVMVGDRVEIEEPDWLGGRGAIAQVLPRQTQLDRPPIANVNQLLLVFALAEPNLDPVQLSRFLVKAESTELRIALALNKADLIERTAQQFWQQRLQQWGYEPLFLSLRQSPDLSQDLSQDLGGIQSLLDQKITVVSGPSGVGKSSLINALIPKVDLRTSAVSGKLGRGRHTTRHVELFELPTGGLLADTPGFNQPDLTCTPSELANYFPEARQRLGQDRCQFSNCLHRDEPNCVVRGDWERYDHYLTFLEEVLLYQQTIERRGEEESTLKVKSKGEGLQQSEPKLAAKKYRRPSRRTEKQTLRHLYQDVDEADAE